VLILRSAASAVNLQPDRGVMLHAFASNQCEAASKARPCPPRPCWHPSAGRARI